MARPDIFRNDSSDDESTGSNYPSASADEEGGYSGEELPTKRARFC
jgi:hypothetical protein